MNWPEVTHNALVLFCTTAIVVSAFAFTNPVWALIGLLPLMALHVNSDEETEHDDGHRASCPWPSATCSCGKGVTP